MGFITVYIHADTQFDSFLSSSIQLWNASACSVTQRDGYLKRFAYSHWLTLNIERISVHNGLTFVWYRNLFSVFVLLRFDVKDFPAIHTVICDVTSINVFWCGRFASLLLRVYARSLHNRIRQMILFLRWITLRFIEPTLKWVFRSNRKLWPINSHYFARQSQKPPMFSSMLSKRVKITMKLAENRNKNIHHFSWKIQSWRKNCIAALGRWLQQHSPIAMLAETDHNFINYSEWKWLDASFNWLKMPTREQCNNWRWSIKMLYACGMFAWRVRHSSLWSPNEVTDMTFFM